LLLFSVHLAHAFLLAHLYPYHIYDTDLFSYFIYFRNWFDHGTSLQTLQFFPVPKPLPVLTLGSLGYASWAFYCTALSSAFLGSLAYLVTRHFLSRTSGVLLSLFLLLDPLKGMLTLTSSADLYLTLFLFLAIHLSMASRPWLSSTCLFLSALIKPITLPCSLYLLVAKGELKKQKWIGGLLPLVAIPLTLLFYSALLGSMNGPSRLAAEFTALRDASFINPQEFLHFVLWTQLVKSRFVLTAPWGFLGILLWLTNDKRHLTSPFLLIPAFFLAGYFILSIFSPYTPLFRFYWFIEVWFLAFLIYGILESARRIFTANGWLRQGVIGLLLFFLLDDSLTHYFRYRNGFALPFEKGMAFVTTSLEVIKQEKRTEETVLTSLAFVPYTMWELKAYDQTNIVVAAEQAAKEMLEPKPDWIVYVPEIVANGKAKDLVGRLLDGGRYELRFKDGNSALFHRKS